MQILSRGVTHLHIALFLLFTLTWLALADAHKVPKFMWSYFFPYEFASRGMGAVALYIVIFQILVVCSYAASLMIKKRKIIANSIAAVFAILWFLFANISVITAHIH